MDLLSYMGVMIVFPILALVPAALFGWIWARRRRRSALVAAVLWLAYAAWESAAYLRLTCTGECNIRIDLLVIYPVLLLVSAIALVMAFRRGDGRA